MRSFLGRAIQFMDGLRGAGQFCTVGASGCLETPM